MIINYVFTQDSSSRFAKETQNRLWLNKSVCFSHTIVLQIYGNETIYLFGNLPFFKIQVNRFMAQENSPCANVISKCMLWVRGLVPISEF